MSDFEFISSKTEYEELKRICNMLEEATDTSEIALRCREVLLESLKLIYANQEKKYPTDATMLEIVDGATITNFINNKLILESIHFIRKLGIDAGHGEKIKKTYAATAKQNIIFFLQFVINKIEGAQTSSIDVLPQYMSEAQTRKIYIDMYLKEAGWSVVDPTEETTLANGVKVKSGAVVPGKACSEVPVEGMKNSSGVGFCDYVLYDKNGQPLAIVEAKRTSESITKGVQQVKDYGQCMKEKYGYVPVLYYTNGYEIRVMDGLYVDRPVIGFHSMDELRYMIQRRSRGKIENMKVDTSIAGRPYQIQAITKVCERFSEKYSRSLIVMATGTGKTRVSIALVKLLLENKWIKNVLFLADRTSLVEQAFKNFKKILPNTSYQVLSDRKLADEPNARVVFSTHQTMINYIDSEQKEYTIGRFDLIIIDEAHRSIFNKYGSIFRYFDSLLVGLTATPRNQVDADTYKLFGCEPGEPHFEYKLETAVKDKYLVPYLVETKTTKLLNAGVKYRDLSDKDKAKVESLIPDEGLPEDFLIPKETLFKIIYNENTCARVLEELMENGMKVDAGQLIGKTIIFAYNHMHAALIVDVFHKMYPNYGNDYCQLIDNQVKNADELINKFGEKDDFRIAVSVDMLDTGIDVPSVLNLVFFKPVRSKIKFVQMIGRGTRLCEKLIDGADKSHFLIFDYFENFAFFDENPDGIENKNGKSLSQRLYDVKLDIMVALQSYENQTKPALKAYYDQLKTYLYGKALDIKKCDYRIAVRDEMPYVDKYIDIERWDAVSPLEKKEIQLHLSKLISNDINQNQNALYFDMRMLEIELSVLIDNNINAVGKQVEFVRKIAKYLLEYAAGKPAVLSKVESLKAVVSVEFWSGASVEKLEQYREDIRELLVYLPPRAKPVVIDTPDEIIDLENNSGLIDIRTYKEKVLDYLLEHSDNPTILKIKNLDKIDANDLMELENILWSELGTAEEYHESTSIDNLAVFIRSIVGIEQEAINEKFGDFLNENVLNSMQQEFVSSIVDYVRENGDIVPEDLIEKSPFDSYNLLDLFGDNVAIISKIINVLHGSVMVA